MTEYVLVVHRERDSTEILVQIDSNTPFGSISQEDILRIDGISIPVVVTEIEHNLKVMPTPGGLFSRVLHEIHLYTRPV